MEIRHLAFVFFFFIPGCLAFAQNNSGEVLVDRVTAIVNGRALFHSEIRKKIQVGPLVVVSEFPAEKDSSNDEKALNDAINFELILGAAKDLDIDISESDLDLEINSYLQEQKIPKEKLLEILSAEGESFESYKRDFRNQLILRKFQRRVIVPSVKITDKDIETYYLTQSTTASTELVEVVLRQITFNLQNTTSKALQNEKKALADEVFTKLKSGLDFSEAIGLYSDDAKDKNETRQQLSVKLVDLAPKIRDVVDPLKTNEFSNPVQIGNTIFIFQVVDRKLAINRDYEKKRQQLEQELRVIELKNQTNKWLSDQRQRIAIKFLDK